MRAYVLTHLPTDSLLVQVLMDYMAAKYADGQREAALPKTPRAGSLSLEETPIVGELAYAWGSLQVEKRGRLFGGRLSAEGIKDAVVTTRRVKDALGMIGRRRVTQPSKEDVNFISSSVADAPAHPSSVSSKEQRSHGDTSNQGTTAFKLSLAPVKKKSMTQTDSSTKAASVMLRTTDGGWYCGQVSGVNVPPEVMSMLPDTTAPKAEQEKVLAASVITALLSAGFTLASQCTLAASSSSQAPPEIAFTLIKSGPLMATTKLASSGSFPVGASTTPRVRKEKEELMDKFGISGRMTL